MTIHQLLEQESKQILQNAIEAMQRVGAKHYEQAGLDHLHQRLKALFTLAARGVKERNLGPMIAHAETIAQERFTAGFDLWEVQAAFNVLEEAIWNRILHQCSPSDFAEALGLVSTVLGAGKDALARRYVELATRSHVPSLNMHSLFSGTEAAGE